MQSANDIRKAFLDYFAAAGHEVVSSSPLVPHNDPTLMFTNAGMVQFKNVFTGAETRPYKRAVSSQKCVRAGGKHNDLDNVGYTARHHTFFEMLGNFSFGDYFKERAIELAWNLITKEFGLDQDRLLVTVYHDDDQAFDLWRKIAGLPEERIIRIATSDNFWAMGDTGPCGPCSEIFFDHGPGIPGGPPGSPDEDGDRFIEIWNLVFMQYEQLGAEQRVELPKPSIDTGMGLERLTALLQGTHDNYDIDLFRSIMDASAEFTNVPVDGPHKSGHKVIADHLRASSFLIADGVLPSNEGRGYVLRRIMRRAMRHAHMMGASDPLMWRLVPTLVGKMGQAFPELVRAEALITETLRGEESRFKQTLDRGLHLLMGEVDKLGAGQALPGDVAFRLYDTYGFPLDLTQDVLRGQNRGVDTDGFDLAMERQRTEARASWAGSGDTGTDRIWFELREAFGATEFLGYDKDHAEGEVLALVVDGARVEAATVGTEVSILVNQTPFYGESGGQQGDAGQFRGSDGVSLHIVDTQKRAGDLHVHRGAVRNGELKVGDVVEMAVDTGRRGQLRANHSATHLLHAAMRNLLGDHITQKGSLVAPDRLRFDVSHPKALGTEELAQIERDVNQQIRVNVAVRTGQMTPDEAVEQGALALFGEKYGDEVRVVSMGEGEGEQPYSTELCGGTHVRQTGDIGAFTIVGESAVAAGVRRIEALTGAAALEYFHVQENQLRAAAEILRTTAGELPERISALLEERKTLERDLSQARQKIALGDFGGGDAAGGGDDGARDVGGIAYAGRRLDGVPAKELRAMVDAAKKKLGSGVVAFIAVNEGKAALTIGVTEDLTDRLSAVDLVRVGAAAVGGKGGGGRPDMAQAGGPDGEAADAALTAIEEAIASAGSG
ncbi:MAG: alanine--tRNA ligase [Alphaproteobacteria bacterium]|nr:alanine--tRNA ligase [Alphaproteobacteria bacterium]